MTDILNAIPPNPPHVRPIGPRTAQGITTQQQWAGSTQTAIYMPFSYPGPITTTGKSGPYPLPRNYSGYVYQVMVALGTPDSGGNDLTVTYYLNGTAFTTLTLPAGDTLAVLPCPGTGGWPIAGTLTDNFQVAITTYAGSTAADLTAHIWAF